MNPQVRTLPASVLRPDVLLGALTERVNAALSDLNIPQSPRELYEPVRYALDAPGKRIRPVMLLLAAEAVRSGASEAALPAAVGVEVFHTFSLVHDDIMDRSDERRGQPTVHVRWDEATAILVGDYLMAAAYERIATTETSDLASLLRVFHRGVTRVCEGQALDTAFEGRDDVTVSAYLDMIEGKTAALLEAALEMGGVIAGADDEVRAALRRAGRSLGRAFQIQDDLLDLTATNASWGKPVGGDLVVGKKTYLLLTALEQSQGDEREFFADIVSRPGLEPGSVDEARDRMERLGVLEAARAAIEAEYRNGLDALALLPEGPSRDALIHLAEQLIGRAF